MILVTGAGRAVPIEEEAGAADPVPFLKQRRGRKFMGVQDDLAVVAAGRALTMAGLLGQDLAERAGLYLAVGYIPFTETDLRPIIASSTEDDRFSISRFTSDGWLKGHPLLTFRCLPNMPAYHISVNFDIQGPYLVSYPGAGQFATALEEACLALDTGQIEIALVAGVAAQRNYLVEHHFRRLIPAVPAERLADAGGCLVLETAAGAARRGARIRAELAALTVAYRNFDPFERLPDHREHFLWNGRSESPALEFGPASLPARLSRFLEETEGAGRLEHELWTRDGIHARSLWQGAA